MKNFLLFSFLLFSIIFSNATYSQKTNKSFEGTITYENTYLCDDKRIDLQFLNMLPKTQTFFIKGDKAKLIVENIGIGNSIIADGNAKIKYQLEYIADSIIAIKYIESDLVEMQKKQDSIISKQIKTDVKYTNDKKTIAGYECFSAIITASHINGSVSNDTVWFNEEMFSTGMNLIIENPLNIKGSQMEFSSKMEIPLNAQGDIASIIIFSKVKEITKKKISDEVFEIPKKCKVIAVKEYIKQMQLEQNNAKK